MAAQLLQLPAGKLAPHLPRPSLHERALTTHCHPIAAATADTTLANELCTAQGKQARSWQ